MEGLNIFIQAVKDNQGRITQVIVFNTETEKATPYAIRTLALAVRMNKIKVYGFSEYSKKVGQPFTYKVDVAINSQDIMSIAICYPDIYVAIISYVKDLEANNKPVPQAIAEYKKILENGSGKFHEYLVERGYI